MASVDLQVEIAGQRFTQTFAPKPNLSYTYTWNGEDAYGRTLQGAWNATITLTYEYQQLYGWSTKEQQAFASSYQMTVSQLQATTLLKKTSSWQVELGAYNQRSLGLGGLSISPHHTYLPMAQTLMAGDGSVRSANAIPGGARPIVGNFEAYTKSPAVGLQAGIGTPYQIALDPEGDLFVADPSGLQVLEVSGSDRKVSRIAGLGRDASGQPVSLQAPKDGASALEVDLAPMGIAQRADGTR